MKNSMKMKAIMRNPYRIPIIIDIIQSLWQKNPELRFGQLLANIIEQADHFNIEDKDLMRKLVEANYQQDAVLEKLEEAIARLRPIKKRLLTGEKNNFDKDKTVCSLCGQRIVQK